VARHFLREQLEDARNGAIFSIAPGEAYCVERTDPENDITRTADVTPLSDEEAFGLPVPDDTTVLPAIPATLGYVVPDSTGHGLYDHGGASQVLAADTPVLLLNDRSGFLDESQMPADVDTFYDGTFITGRSGDGMLISISLTFTPSDQVASDLAIWLDIGGTFTRIFGSSNELAFGEGEPHLVRKNLIAYNRDTWQANGGRVWVETKPPAVFVICEKRQPRPNRTLRPTPWQFSKSKVGALLSSMNNP